MLCNRRACRPLGAAPWRHRSTWLESPQCSRPKPGKPKTTRTHATRRKVAPPCCRRSQQSRMEPSGSCRTCVDPRVVSCWAAYFAKTSAAAAVGIVPDTTTPVAGGAAAATTLKRIIEGAMPSIWARSDLTESSFDAVYSDSAPTIRSCTVAVLGIAKLGAPVLGVAGLNTQNNNTFLKIRPIIAASSRAAPGGGREQRPYGHRCAHG